MALRTLACMALQGSVGALGRVASFQRTDCSLRSHMETVVLQVDTEVGRPRVNYHEAITRRADFDYLHKKQSGARSCCLLPLCPPQERWDKNFSIAISTEDCAVHN